MEQMREQNRQLRSEAEQVQTRAAQLVEDKEREKRIMREELEIGFKRAL